jgi:hypothetical protein
MKAHFLKGAILALNKSEFSNLAQQNFNSELLLDGCFSLLAVFKTKLSSGK